MKVTLVSAMAKNRVIGKDNCLPWNLPEDMKHFRRVTRGKPIVMGRLTLESMGGKPLPHRRNVVLTRNKDYRPASDEIEVFSSLSAALEKLRGDGVEETMIIGGAQIYAEAIPVADKIILSIIHKDFEGDAEFPEIPAEWSETKREPHPDATISFDVVEYERG